jgi:hypothetical protein
MARVVAVMVALALAGCASSKKNPSIETLGRSGGVMEVAVGSPMVDDRSTKVTVTALVPKPRVDGSRTQFVYLGFLGTDPVGRRTIRVRYEEHKIADGVESETPSLRAEVQLDLGLGRTIDFEGWRIDVLDATESRIRFEVVGTPSR